MLSATKYLGPAIEILRFAQNDREGAQDNRESAQDDILENCWRILWQ